MSSETVIVEKKGRVGLIRLNRPSALNALNSALKDELLEAAKIDAPGSSDGSALTSRK